MSQQRSGGAKDLVITCIKGEGKFLKFWALPISGLDTVKNFESHLGNLKQDLDSSLGFARSDQIPLGFRCVVKSKIKQNRWCRAGVLAHQGYNAILVRLLDYGNDEAILVSDVRNIEDPIMPVQPQAIECILADVMPVHNEWTIEAIKFCEQHLLYNTLSCYVVSEYMKLPVVRVAKKGESEAFVQRLINGGLALIKRETVSPPPATLSYKMNTMDPNTNHLVRISCIENAHKFYVQLSAAEMELKHLMDSINRLPKESFVPLKVPAVSTPCLAQLSTKACYYRALITYIQQSQCKVFFVDYGFSEQKDIHELRAIPPAFLNLSAQAICCSLPREANIDPEEFKRVIGHEHLELHVLTRTNEAYIVRLFFRGQDLLMPPQSVQNYIPQKLNINAKCEVTVSYVNDLSEFYCQLTQMKEQQNIISNILNTGYSFTLIFLDDCTPGKPVCAKFSEDNLWYRARIIKVNHENDIEVFFVDFGNYDNVNLSDVRKIGPDLLKFPVQAFKCFLHDTPLPIDSKARDDAFDLLEELTTDQNLFAHINSFAGDAGYGVTLYMKNSPLSVNEKLASKFMSIPVVSVDDIEDVYVTVFDSCKSFFVQFEKIDSDKLTNMQDEINTFYSGAQNKSFVPNEGSLVCARFHEDDQFYRGRVEKCKNGQCEVFFIDYGNRESIPLRDVHMIDPKFIQYHQFGTECAFENIAIQVPNDKLSDVMLENSFKFKMVRKEGEKWYVSLVENFPGNAAVLDLIRQSEVSSSSAKRGTNFGGYQEKQFNSQAAHSDSLNNDVFKASHLTNKNEVIKNYNNEHPKKEFNKSSEPVQEFTDFSSISIPPKAYRNIYVSHIVSPGEFYCQIEEDSTKLQLLMKTIEDTYVSGTDHLSLSNFSIDAPCCAMFEDGIWYRGKIKKVDVETCDIFFVDYGNTDSVSKTKIKKLRNDLFRWQSQAVCCKAFNISPKSKDWNDDEINAFIDMALDKSFIAQFVECDTNNCYAVNLCSIGKLEDNIFNKEFVTLGYGRLQDTNKSIVLNPHAASTNLSFNPPDINIGCSEAVQVFYGLNPGEIFCQLKSYEQEFKQMMINMQNYYKNVAEAESLIDRPHQGMICAAQFSLDSAWYRAEIKKVETNKIIVFYVDYGNSENVDRKKIRCIIQEYTVLPIQAIKCRIRGIKPPGKSWMINNNLEKYFEGDVQCKFICKEGDSYLVDLTCNQKDVAQLLISDRLAVSDGSTVQTKNEDLKETETVMPKFSEKQSLDNVKSDIMQNIIMRKDTFTQGQLLSVTVSFIENPLKFWCQLLDECDVLNELVEKIENEIIDYPSINPSSLKIGSYCMAQYSEDEAWYRAQIKSFESGNTYKVFFIDYGNSEVVSLPQMKVMIPELMEQPPFCFECSLQNAPSKLLPEMTTLFSDTVTDVDEITAKIEKVHSGICTVTLLFDKDDQEMNVNELLFGVKDDVIESGDISSKSPRFLPPDVPLGLHDGYVSVVKSPQDFYIQLAGTEDPLADLSEELVEVSESSANVNLIDLCPGYACFTKYSEDNNWYRAEVIDIQDSTVSVLFVDYGNIETVEQNSLKCLSDKHLQMPSQAIKCKLNGIVPVAEEWTEEAITTFQDMVLDACLGITFISKDIPATVNIIKDDKEVAQCLVDMELANFQSCIESDEAYAEDHLAPAPIEDPLSSLPNDQSYPERKLSSLKHIVKISYVDCCDKFFITPLELGTELDTVSATLEILYDPPNNTEGENSNSPVTDILEDPKISMPCVAKYSVDDKWYRAVITEIEEENIFVKFIDYGNSEISSLTNLRPLAPELLKIPPIALECSLFGIVAKPGKEQEITTKFEEYFLDEMELEVEIIEFSPYKVKLFHNGDDIASSLVKDGLAEEQCILPVESVTFVDNSKMTFVDESLEYKIQISKRFFSGADKIIGNVKFCEIENDLMVFHVVSTDLEDDLQNLQQKLQDAYCEPSQNLTHFSCMDFCATKYMEDENWYRAQILSVEKDKIKVRFIDYGNCETVDKSDIYELLGDFTIEPQFSVKCILFGLKVDKSKEIELQNKLDEYVYHEPVELKLCKHSHAVCDLCITSVICGNTDITELISNEKLVQPQYIINCQLDDVFKAIVQKIDDDVIFLLPLSVIDEREAFQCKLQNLCKDLEKLSNIQIDHLCAAKVDDVWYRVSVKNISDSEVTVDLVDFGFNKVTTVSEFVPLPLDICHQPIFLQPCVVHIVGDCTGNAKIINREDLSVGCEVSCELQKVYPLVQPLSVKLIEIHSGFKKTDAENDELNIQTYATVNDSESFTDDIKVPESESCVDSKTEEYFSQNENETENDTNINESEPFIGSVKDLEAESCVESKEDEYISQNENKTENDTNINESEPYIGSVKDLEAESCVESKEDEYISQNENKTENDTNINESEPFIGSVKDLEAESCVESKEDEYISQNENKTENDTNINESEPYIGSVKDLEAESCVESKEDEYISQNENKTEIDELDVVNDTTINDSESFASDIKISETEPFVDSVKDELIPQNESDLNKVSIEPEIAISNSESNTGDIEVSGDNFSVDSKTEECLSDNLKENEVFELESDDKKEEIFEETPIKDEADVKELIEDVSDGNDEIHNIYQENTDTFSENVCHESFEEKEVTEIENYESKNNELEENALSHELDEDSKSDKEDGNDEFAESAAFNKDTTHLEKEENDEKNNSISDLTEQDNEIKAETLVTSSQLASDDSTNCTEVNNSELPSCMKEEISTDSEGDIAKPNSDHNIQCNDILESSQTLDEHFDEIHEDNCNEIETSENTCMDDQNKSSCELIDDHQTSVDAEITSQLKCEKPETSNLSYCSTESERDMIEGNVNSFEDADVKENNRAIEESYQLAGLVPVKVSHIAISDGSVIFAVQPLYLQEEFLLLKESIQEFYSSKAVPHDVSSDGNYCVTYHEGEWCRGKILQSGDSTMVLLIDYGEWISVTSSDIKKLDNDHSNVPPFAVWCTLSSAVCSPEKKETTRTFLCDKLKKDTDAVVKILEGGEPYKINLFVNGESILNHLLKNSLVMQKLPNMYLEPGSHKAKLSFINIKLGSVEIYVNLSSFCADYNTLFEDMQKGSYKVEDFVSNVVESGIYAAFYNDSWYRGLVVSSGNEVQIHLVDTGETVIGCKNLCFLLPEHCLQPAYAIPCHIPFSDIQATDEEIFESINGVLKTVEFLVNVTLCPDTKSPSATLIDEQIMSEVKNIRLTCASAGLEAADIKMSNDIETDISDSSCTKLSCTDSSPAASNIQKQNISQSSDENLLCSDSSPAACDVQNQDVKEQLVGYIEETFTAES